LISIPGHAVDLDEVLVIGLPARLGNAYTVLHVPPERGKEGGRNSYRSWVSLNDVEVYLSRFWSNFSTGRLTVSGGFMRKAEVLVAICQNVF